MPIDTHPHLRALVTAAARHDAEYGPSLSNHLPMALAALARLGASDERLDEFAQRYARRLAPAPPRQPWPAGEAWRARLGQPAAWPAYQQLFRDWIAHEGAHDLLAQALPPLMRGVGAAAFHGPLRVAYALDLNHADELADGLAYWACRWFDCGAPPHDGSVDDPATVLARLAPLAAAPASAPLISQRMAAMAARGDFMSAVAAWHIDARSTLPRLARLAAERYAAEGDFTVLHLVTSAHAVHRLLPWIDDADGAARRDAVGAYAVAFAAAWATCAAAPQTTAAPATTVLPWDDLAARAVASDDEHVIKLVDSGRELETAFGGAAWALAASRVVAEGA
jgi:Questin oxidase-like